MAIPYPSRHYDAPHDRQFTPLRRSRQSEGRTCRCRAPAEAWPSSYRFYRGRRNHDGATRALALRGIAVGRDIAVVGFDDIADAEHNAPPLTTVSANTREMGKRCAEGLLGLIRREDPASLSFAGDARLIVRESC